MAVAAEHGTAYLWLKRNLVMFAAMIANDLKPGRRIQPRRGLFCSAFRTPLRCHQVSLVKDLLLFLGEKKRVFALHANGLDIGHRTNLLDSLFISVARI
jgi:hypothetical protein